MDNRPSLHCESIVVQMEEDELDIPPPHPSDDNAKKGRNWHPVLAVDESAGSRLKSFQHPREPAPAVTTASARYQSMKRKGETGRGSSNQCKLDTTARKQLQVQVRGPRQSEATRGVEIEELHKGRERMGGARRSSLTNVQSPEGGGRSNQNDTIIDLSSRERVRPGTPEKSSTDSETGTSQNGDKVSTTAIGSQTSEESQKVGQKDRMGSSTTTGTDGDETEERVFINEAWDKFETSWKCHIEITGEEKQNGYRFLHRIDESYLGFHPKRNDKREFLKAYPISGTVVEARLGYNCPMPMTFAQWSCVAVFFMILAGLGVGGYFYFDKDSKVT